jgi:hypothetical protein
MIRVALRRIIGVFRSALHGVWRRAGAESPTLAVDYGHANARSTEIDTRYQSHHFSESEARVAAKAYFDSEFGHE